MAVRKILLYPADKAALRAPSAPVERFDRAVKQLIKDLIDTLAAHPAGIGLAAPQINVQRRVVIVCLGAQPQSEIPSQPPIVLINPQILEAASYQKDFDGCLSFPGLFGMTVRPHFLRVFGLNESGQPFTRTFKGFDAVVVHHELDHLDGVLFIDRIENPEDLYRIDLDEQGHPVRVPLSQFSDAPV